MKGDEVAQLYIDIRFKDSFGVMGEIREVVSPKRLLIKVTIHSL